MATSLGFQTDPRARFGAVVGSDQLWTSLMYRLRFGAVVPEKAATTAEVAFAIGG